jgi:hypothetical protein
VAKYVGDPLFGGPTEQLVHRARKGVEVNVERRLDARRFQSRALLAAQQSEGEITLQRHGYRAMPTTGPTVRRSRSGPVSSRARDPEPHLPLLARPSTTSRHSRALLPDRRLRKLGPGGGVVLEYVVTPHLP